MGDIYIFNLQPPPPPLGAEPDSWKESGMPSYSSRRFQLTRQRVWKLAREHVRGAVALFVASIIVLPLAAWGSDMKHEAWTLFVYGMLGPLALYLVVFAFYWIRAPAVLDAERVSEIRTLRIAQGLPVEDAEPAPPRPWFEYIVSVMGWIAILSFFPAVFGDYVISRQQSQVRAAIHRVNSDLKTLSLERSVLARAVLELCPDIRHMSPPCKRVYDRLQAIQKLGGPPAKHPPA